MPQRGEGGDRSVPQPSASGPLPVQDILAKYNPGVAGQNFTVGDAAKFIAAGSDIVFEIHYTTTGKPGTDRSAVGIVLADGPPPVRHLTVTGTNNGNIDIAPGDANHEIRGEATLASDAKLVWVQPHQHYRGRYFEMDVVYPNGERKKVLRVPNYRFDWQVGYELAEPLNLPKGTRLETLGRYDNSAANKFNPDPSARVRFGLQSNDEMHVAFMGVLVDAKADPTKIFVRRGRGVAPAQLSLMSHRARPVFAALAVKDAGLESRGEKRQTRPSEQQSHSADRRDRAEHACAGQRQRVETSRENQYAGYERPAGSEQQSRAAEMCDRRSDRQQRERVVHLVPHADLEHRHHLGRQPFPQPMCAERAECDAEEA